MHACLFALARVCLTSPQLCAPFFVCLGRHVALTSDNCARIGGVAGVLEALVGTLQLHDVTTVQLAMTALLNIVCHTTYNCAWPP